MSQYQTSPEWPTTSDVIQQLGVDRSKYVNKVVLITGASSGIGVETARAFASLGCVLYLPVRDRKKMAEVVKDLHHTHPDSVGKIHVLDLDLTSLESVRRCAADFLNKSKQLNILILNAGIMATPEGRTVDGFELQFGSNHLAHFLLLQLLLPTLVASSTPALRSRVISLSSTGHNLSPIHFGDYDLKKAGYDRWTAYGQSKTANIYLATEVERRYGDKGVHALAVHPGGIATGLGKHMLADPLTPDEMERFGMPRNVDPEAIWRMVKLKNTDQGASTTMWGALNPDFENKAGFYLEDTHVGKPKPEGEALLGGGHAKWVYNTQDATRLWEESLKLVGL